MEISKKPTAVICLSPYFGGMEIDSVKLAKKLSTFMKITIIAKEDCPTANSKNDYLGFNDIELKTVKFKSSISVSIMSSVRKIIKKNNIKNVIFFGSSELKSIYFSLLGLDINLIVRHGTTKSTPKKDWFHKLIYSRVNYHVSISNHLLQNVRHIIPFGKHTKDRLIFPSFKFTKVKHKYKNKLTLLHVGRIASGKGQLDAIKACEILIQNNIDFEFNIVGDFDKAYKDEFLNFYKNCNYKNKIHLIGFTKDIQSYLVESDIFLFPSYGEGFGNAFIEAISNDLVCITYENTSFIEFNRLGLHFTMSKNKDIEKLKTTILEIVQTLKHQKKLSKNHELTSELFSEKKEINSYLDILK